MGYYAQQGMKLSGDKRVIEVVKDIAEYMDVGKGERITASQLCKRFLFDDKMQHTFVSKLSGGEKRRLFLLTILVKNPNFLIMDEPTNDLDIQTLNVLEEFLENYKGCLLMVTHDRYFMDKLVDHLWVFEGDGAIRDFNGNYQDYLDEQAVKTELAKPVSSSKSAPEKPKPKNQLTYNEKREYEQLCIDLEKLQARKVDLETQLSQPDLGYEQITQLAGELEQLKQTLDEKELRWLELEEKQSNT
jgi:ATP-binding cassette subfamily F protein uup